MAGITTAARGAAARLRLGRNSAGAFTSTHLEAAHEVDATDAHPFVAQVKAFSDTVLRPSSLHTEVHGVDTTRIDQLRSAGLLNHLAPTEYGGLALDRASDRRVHELLSQGCFNTWLVWAQHAPLSARIVAAQREGRPSFALAEKILRGEILLGAAVSDVRRYPDTYITARRHDDGWILDGTVSWVSGWGLNAALTVAAVDPTTETVVTALIEVSDQTVGTPLALSAVEGSRTERVRLTGVFVPDEQVLSTQPLTAWHHADIGVASDARPHHFGLAARVLSELEASDHPLAHDVAEAWRPRVAQIRTRAYALTDEAAAAGGGPHRLSERLATKVASGEALQTLTRALLVARSGRGLAGTDTAQLHARSALFVLVQGQTPDVRAAQLRELAR